MGTSVTPEEVRIEHSAADQAALGRAFLAFYATLALGALLFGLLVQPEVLPGVALFSAFLVWWRWRVRQAQATAGPWVLRLSPEELEHSHGAVDVRVTRAEATEVRIQERPGPRMRIRVLEVRGRDGAVVLSVSLPGPDEATMLEAACEEWGWPLRG